MKMIQISIPGQRDLMIENVVFDFNGTLATDGILDQAVKDRLLQLKGSVNVFILTSDTYGTVADEFNGFCAQVKVLKGDNVSAEKRKFVYRYGAENTICIGNGNNDIGMFQICALSILIIGDEGCSVKALMVADIAVKSIVDALDMLINPQRIMATLRG